MGMDTREGGRKEGRRWVGCTLWLWLCVLFDSVFSPCSSPLGGIRGVARALLGGRLGSGWGAFCPRHLTIDQRIVNANGIDAVPRARVYSDPAL